MGDCAATAPLQSENGPNTTNILGAEWDFTLALAKEEFLLRAFIQEKA